MGETTGISWTDATFNPWWGCEKVSPGCDLCYAEGVAARFNTAWGKDVPRRFFGEHHWNEPRRWNKKAEKAGVRKKVFCASIADVMEDRRDLDPWREKLWGLIEATPWLTWQLLTKRPENYGKFLPWAWQRNPRPNVWLGTTGENQRRLDERAKALFAIDAAVYWLSAEPLLGPLNLGAHRSYEVETGQTTSAAVHGFDWVVVGGESGLGARRMDPAWATSILEQCRSYGMAYFFKQKGDVLAKELGCTQKSGKNPAEWPAEFRVQEFPREVA